MTFTREKAKTPRVGGKTIAGLERLPNPVIRELRDRQYACVYAIGPKEIGTPVKIGMAADIGKRFSDLQSGTYHELVIHHIVWTPGYPIAKNLERACHEILTKAGKRLRGEWFDVTPEWAKRTINTMAQRPNMIVMSHEQVVEKAKAAVIKKYGKLNFGVGIRLPGW